MPRHEFEIFCLFSTFKMVSYEKGFEADSERSYL